MGEVLIAGMAAMLICIFLGPKFIEYLRVKEFGQHIRCVLPKRRGFRHEMAKPRQHGQRHGAKLRLRNARSRAIGNNMLIR